jgi:ATP-dependent helicase/DNAse subunit B
MSGVVHVVTGPDGSGKTERLLARYRSVARAGVGTAVWLTPTRRAADERRRQLAPASFLSPGVFPLQDFVDEVIRVNDPAACPLSDVQRRLLADDLVGQLHAEGELSHFHRVVDTLGFGEGVFAFLAELKRNGVRPDQLAGAVARRPAAAETGAALKARQCVVLYDEYQKRLIRQNLYDLEGRCWYVRDLLLADRRRPFEHVRAVFVDGFTDFTGVQHEILAALAKRVEELWVTLPDEPGGERAELFARPRAAHARLGPVRHEQTAAAAGERPAGLVHLERQLFRPLRALIRSADADGLLLLKAPGTLGETRMVAREVKKLLLAGVPADDVLVTLRDLSPYADLVREVFDEYGIPLDVEGIEPLRRDSAVATLLRAARLPAGGWPFAGVTALLRSNYFRPNWPETRACAEIAGYAEGLLRFLGEPRGREAYLAAVGQWAERPRPPLEDELAEESRNRRMHELAKTCRPFLERFFKCWDRLPARGTPAAHTAALRQFADEIGLTGAADAWPTNAAALGRLWEELERWAEMDRRLQDGERPRDADQFHRLLAALTSQAGLARTPRGPGRVRVLSAPLARTVAAPYVFLMGLGERSFPRLAAPEPFFDEAERRSLKEAGLDFGSLSDLLPDEMLLFYQVVTRARRRLVLSYPAVDEKGQSLLPSSFLQAVLDCFEDEAVPARTQCMLIEGIDREVPLSPAEYRVRAGARAQAEGGGLPTHLAANLAAARRVARARFSDREFGPYDGLLRHPAALAELSALVGPERVFSPTALEDYVACPFRFFLRHVVRLEPFDDPREEIEVTRRGQAFHRALARLHHRLRTSDVERPTPELEASLREELDRAVEEYAARAAPATGVLWRLEGQRLRRLARRYPAHWVRFLEPWLSSTAVPRPHFLEASFGMPAEGDGTPAEPLVVVADGVEIRVRGRIDRVDLAELEDGLGFWVIDYKTGRADRYTGKSLATFERLQLTLYALAVERVLLAGRRARPLGLAYWLVADEAGPRTALPTGRQPTAWLCDGKGWQEVRGRLEHWIATLARHMRHGTFALSPRAADCTATCDYGQICRITQAPSVPKGWRLPLPTEGGP